MVFTEVFNPIMSMMSIEQKSALTIYGVPTMFIAILEHPLFPKFDLLVVAHGIMAGSVCPVHTMRQVTEKMYMKQITSVYGPDQSSPGMTQTDVDDPYHTTLCEGVGRAFPHERGQGGRHRDRARNCPRGKQGELCCRGYNAPMKGYYKNPEATAKCIDPERWLIPATSASWTNTAM
jgi:fatty-acyl-CoA synthase